MPLYDLALIFGSWGLPAGIATFGRAASGIHIND